MIFYTTIGQNKYQIVFILYTITYFLFYGPYGYDDADNGYTLALSWRIFNGEIPYKDFILVRPPLSPILHALPLYIIPDSYQILFDRFIFYLLIALNSLFGAFTLDRTFNLNKEFLNPYLLATIGFVFSIVNFPPMAWHTVDAIFFASAGIFTLVCFSSLFSVIIGIFLLFLSAMCKQPFYLMPFLGVLFVFLIDRNRLKKVLSILSLTLFCSIFFLILYKNDLLTSFIHFTTGSLNLRDLFTAGFKDYVRVDSLFLILPFALYLILNSAYNSTSIKIELVPFFVISLLLFLPVTKFIYTLLYKVVSYDIFYKDSTSKIFFLVTLFYLFINFSLEKKWITLWFLLSVSWCSGINWGFQIPVLFSIPLMFGFFMVSNQFFHIKKITKLAHYTLILGTIVYFVANQKPYCNPIRQKLTYEISDLFPKLRYIKVSKETKEKYTELSEFVSQYGSNFKTLPGMPLSNYLTNTNSPIKIDWVFNAETSTENNNIINALRLKKPIIFIEKNPLIIGVSNPNGKWNSAVTFLIKENWQKVDSSNYFEVYQFK